MWKAKSLLCLSLLSLFITTTSAHARTFIEIDNAPPSRRVEAVPSARRGYVWAPGYWNWNARARRHTWIRGRWIPARRGQHWVGEHWEKRGNRYFFESGHWERH